jgi:hypothetical protein
MANITYLLFRSVEPDARVESGMPPGGRLYSVFTDLLYSRWAKGGCCFSEELSSGVKSVDVTV